VDVGIGGRSLVGSYFAGLPVLREVARRRRVARAGPADKESSRKAGRVMDSPAPSGQPTPVDQS